MRSLEIIMFLLVSGLGGGVVGAWACGSSTVWRWVATAQGCCSERRPRYSRLSWALATAAAAGAVAAAWLAGNANSSASLVFVPLIGWACGLSVLGLIDAHHRVLPTPIARAAVVGTGTSLAAVSFVSGAGRELVGAAGAASAAAVVYGAWSLVRPRSLGFGDVRMACLVALGVGARSLPVATVVLSCAPLAAGIGSKCRAAPTRHVPVPLGPFLAVAGLMGVVAGAL